MKFKVRFPILLAIILSSSTVVGTAYSAQAVNAANQASIPNPSGFTVTSNIPDNFSLNIDSATQLGDAELLSGGPAITLLGDYGRVSFLGLAEKTQVSFRYRNKIYDSGTLKFRRSAWVTFSFRTPSFNSLRPDSPTGLRVVERSASDITLRWNSVTGATRYTYSVDGGPEIPTGQVTCVYCSTNDPLTARIRLPLAGTTTTIKVTAYNAPASVNCGPYCFPDLRFTNSKPALLTITG